MKRLLFICLCLVFLSPVASAQIVFEQQDFPQVGIIQYRTIDTSNLSGLNLGGGGPNQTWDFSGLQDQRRDTVEYINPSLSSFGTYYPNANLGIWEEGKGIITYTNNGPVGIEVEGYVIKYGGDSLPIIYQDKPIYLPYPLTYQTSITDSAYINQKLPLQYNPPVDSAHIKRIVSNNKIADAYGTLITPEGSYNVVRVATVEISIDTAWGYISFLSQWQMISTTIDTGYRYDFIAEDIGFVSTVKTDQTGNPLWTGYFLSSVVVGQEIETDTEWVDIFPNPASDRISFKSKIVANCYVDIYDVSGRRVIQALINGAQDQVDVSALLPGLYLYQLTGPNGETARSGKLQIAR